MELIKKNMPQYKANLHCHTTLSDGKLTPSEVKKAYKEEGYSVLCITDHEYPCDHSQMTEKDFLMLTGYEAYIKVDENAKSDPFTPEIHINLIAKEPHNTAYVCYNDKYCKYVKDENVKAAFKKVGPTETRKYTPEYINSFVKAANENGYLCTHNHPYWSLEELEVIKKYEGFFSMEIFNYSSSLLNGLEYNAPIYDSLLNCGKRLFCHAADDNHNGYPFGSPGCDSFGGFTMIMAESLDYSSIISALEKGDFYASMGPIIHSVKIENNKIFVECSGAKQITAYFGGRKGERVFGTKDAPLLCAEIDVPEVYKYIRIDVVDFEGKHANTRAVFKEEL